MAEQNDNWFGSWLTAAKNKSCEVLEFVKKDLEEFGTAMKSEATNVVATTGNAIEKTLKLDEPESTASTMKRSISSFLGQMNEVLNPSPDDSDTEAMMIVEGQETVTLTTFQKELYELQKNELTFIEDPDRSMLDQYQCWLEIIDDQLSEERLQRHLISSVALKNQYTNLVPMKVEHGVFWKRYLFKKALLEDDIARKEALEKREMKYNNKPVTEDTVQWDQEDFAKDIELTEEEQIKLLEQYENETKEKKTTEAKPSSPKATTNELIGEQILFQQKPNGKVISPKKKGKKKQNSDDTNTKTTNSSNSSTDGEWEKISDSDK